VAIEIHLFLNVSTFFLFCFDLLAREKNLLPANPTRSFPKSAFPTRTVFSLLFIRSSSFGRIENHTMEGVRAKRRAQSLVKRYALDY